jgi:membrane-associated PAP2 superfamily phosphatase
MPLSTTLHPHVFWRNHLQIPLVIFSLLAVSIELGGIDMWLADKFYAWEGGRWALKNAWITSAIIHNLGKHLSLLIALIILLGFVSTYISPRVRAYRPELLYLLVAAGGGSVLISILKDITHVSCAWDFSRYGGETEYATVFTQLLHRTGDNCFPAGHASGGYAWLASYFLGLHLNSKWRWAGLGLALSVGLIFGISQQLRGAHFISHDLWTLGICWFFSLFIFKLMLLGKSPQQQ